MVWFIFIVYFRLVKVLFNVCMFSNFPVDANKFNSLKITQISRNKYPKSQIRHLNIDCYQDSVKRFLYRRQYADKISGHTLFENKRNEIKKIFSFFQENKFLKDSLLKLTWRKARLSLHCLICECKGCLQ